MNYKILRAPVLPKTEKNVTTTQPFKFTEVKFQSKVVYFFLFVLIYLHIFCLFLKPAKVEEEKIYEFHAKPAPKTTAPGSIPISRRSVLPTAIAKKTTRYNLKYQADTMPSVCEVWKLNLIFKDPLFITK